MAIAFDAATAAEIDGTSYTRALTVGSGTDRYLAAFVWVTAGDVLTGVTYAGVSMTQAVKVKYSSTNEHEYLYVIFAPTSGSNNIVVSGSAGECWLAASAYTGVKQANTVNASATQEASGSPITQSVTPSVANCWAIAGCMGQRNATSSTGVTNRAGDGTQAAVGDSNATITNGSPYSMSYTVASPVRQQLIVAAIEPPPPVTATGTTVSMMGVG